MRAESVKVRQRVRVRWAYKDGNSDAAIAVVMEVRGESVRVDNLIGWFHCSQLRLLKPKKRQPRALDERRLFANFYPGDTYFSAYASRELADLKALPNLRTEVWELAIVARHPVEKKS